MAIEITFPKDSLKKLNTGVRKIYNIIKTTIGPKGNIVVKDNLNLNTGKEILDAITLFDQFENVAVEFLSDLVSSIEEEVADGTKTAIIIFSNLFFDMYRLINRGYLRSEIEDSINNIKNEVKLHFAAITTSITDPEILGAVIDGHSFNLAYSNLITEVLSQYNNIGITVEPSKDDLTYTLQKGITLGSGFLSLQMVKDINNYQTILKKPLVILLEQNSELPVILSRSKEPLLLLMNDVDNESINLINKNLANSKREIVAIKVDPLDPLLEDIVILGNLKNIQGYFQGIVNEVIVSKDRTIIINNSYNQAYLETLQNSLLNLKGRAQLDLRTRIGSLSQGIVNISAPENNIASLERALISISNANLYGTVLGEGLGYVKVARYLDSKEFSGYDKIIRDILIDALYRPYEFILQNGGISSKNYSPYDFALGKFVNSEYFQIFDSLKVVETVIINSLEMLKRFLRYNIIIID